METYEFYQDKKVSIWERTYFSVNAETYDHALEKVKKHYEKDISDVEVEDNSVAFSYYELVSDTVQEITLKANEGYSTCEVYSEDGSLICGNGKNQHVSNTGGAIRRQYPKT